MNSFCVGTSPGAVHLVGDILGANGIERADLFLSGFVAIPILIVLILRNDGKS
jgi:hypothetical protein